MQMKIQIQIQIRYRYKFRHIQVQFIKILANERDWVRTEPHRLDALRQQDGSTFDFNSEPHASLELHASLDGIKGREQCKVTTLSFRVIGGHDLEKDNDKDKYKGKYKDKDNDKWLRATRKF